MALALGLSVAACSARSSGPSSIPVVPAAAVQAQPVPATASADPVETKIKNIICNQLEVPIEQVRPEASFVDDLKADSLAVVELILAFEQEFRITIPEEETARIKTVKDAIANVKSHLK